MGKITSVPETPDAVFSSVTMAVQQVGSENVNPPGSGEPGGPDPDVRPSLEIAHVLFMDLVGYSKMPMEEQSAHTQRLQAIVRETRAYQSAHKAGCLLSMPTGDGMVLVFFGDPTGPAECALEISRALNNCPYVKLRMGVHTGPVYRVSDINANQNVAGAGINFAQRVMDCGDAGHILVSSAVADNLRQFGKFSDQLHDIGEYEVKHGVVVHLFNLYGANLGNQAPPARGRKPRGMPRRTAVKWMGGGIGATLAGLLGWYEFPRTKQKLVAILPFRNIGADPANQAFCDGLVETVTSKLTEMQQFQDSLWVVPASETHRESLTSARQARQMFGANLVLTGSLQREAGHLRLAMNLVDTGSLRQLQAITMDSQLQDPEALQDGVVTACARMLDIELHPAAHSVITAGGTSNPRAYDLYLQAQGYLQEFDKPGSIDRALALFRQALQVDPDYAAALAGQGQAYWRKYHDTRDTQFVDEALKSCDRAVALDDKIAAAHVYLGTIYAGTGKSDPAVAEFRKALALDPVNADAYRGLAGTYDKTGRADQAETVYKRAIELRPTQWIGYSYLGVFYYGHGRYPEAETAFRRILALAPGNYVGSRVLGALYLTMGRYKEAGQVLEKAMSIRPDATIYNNLANVYAFEQRYREAAALMEKALALSPKDYRFWGTLGDIYAAAPGEARKAGPAYANAIEFAGRELAVNPNDGEILSDLAVFHARTSSRADALAEIGKALQLSPDNNGVLQNAVVVYELTGNRDRALRAVQDAVAKKYSLEEIRRQPGLAALRNDPVYQRLTLERK